MKRFFLLSLILFFLLQACSKDELKEVQISFISPTNNQQVSLEGSENFIFRINLSAEKDLHDYQVLAYPLSNPSDKIIDVSGHRHRTFIELTYERDLSSYPADTEIVVLVEVCVDHDCKKTPIRESINFTLTE